MKLTFLGLGAMGYPMAGHLADKSGGQVTVYNRTTAKAKAWADDHPEHLFAPTVAEAVNNADIVCCCVGDDPDLETVLLDPNHGALANMKAGSLLVDHTTASHEIALKLASEAEKRGIGFVDAPVSGGEIGAINGQLSIMAGGTQADFDRALPILNHYAKACQLMGGVGSGQLTKMVNQICIAGLVQGLSEGIAFGLNAGLDMDKVLDVISKGAAGSWQMDNRGKTMVEDRFDFGFAIDWMRKDLRICLQQARANGSSLPVTALVDQFYANLQDQGKGRQDTSSLIQALPRLFKNSP